MTLTEEIEKIRQKMSGKMFVKSSVDEILEIVKSYQKAEDVRKKKVSEAKHQIKLAYEHAKREEYLITIKNHLAHALALLGDEKK